MNRIMRKNRNLQDLTILEKTGFAPCFLFVKSLRILLTVYLLGATAQTKAMLLRVFAGAGETCVAD